MQIEKDYLSFWTHEIFNGCANNKDNTQEVINELWETLQNKVTKKQTAEQLFNYMSNYIACEYPTNDPIIQNRIDNALNKLWHLSVK